MLPLSGYSNKFSVKPASTVLLGKLKAISQAIHSTGVPSLKSRDWLQMKGNA